MAHTHDAFITGPLADRRRDERHTAMIQATIRPMFDRRQACITCDLSRTGGRFLTPRPLGAGDQLILDLYIDTPDGSPYRTAARVVWAQRRPATEMWRYTAALEFEHPSAMVELAARAQSEKEESDR